MTASSEPIREAVVAGGGIVGWSAAAALRRRLPWLSVTIVPLAPPPDALGDRIGSTLPSVLGFHDDLGLAQDDAVLRTGSAFRLGSLFAAWAEGLPDYVHAYGQHGRPFGTASFHQHWVRAARAGAAAPFDLHSPAAVLARAGRFAPPAEAPDAVLAGYEYGLQIDPASYRGMMRAFALHCGVRERGGDLAGVRLRAESGFIEALTLNDGTECRGDLFVDCTGPAARLRSTLDQCWEDWARWLPCDRILFADTAPLPEPPPLDRVEAVPIGWRWTAAGLRQTAHGLVYASAWASDDDAARVLRAASGAEPHPAPIAIAPGARPEPWLRNCVALGDAATVVEPLEWTNLHLAHSAIDRMIAMLPGRDCAAVEIGDFNRQCAAETQRVRDFVLLHYAVSSRSEPLWREAASVELAPSLAHSLNQFRERGRLPFYEEETFSRDSWLAVLLGQGVIPRRVDPLIETIPPVESDRAMAVFRDSIATAVAPLPSHSAFLRHLTRPFAR